MARRVAIAASIGLSLRARDLAGRVREVRDREGGGMVVMCGSRHGALGPVPFGRALAVSFDFGRPGGGIIREACGRGETLVAWRPLPWQGCRDLAWVDGG